MSGIDEQRLNDFIGRILGDLGGAYSVALVRLGEELGLYRSLHEDGPASAAMLAQRLGMHERYVREWLAHHAASGYVDYDESRQEFSLSPEQAMVFADPQSPVFLLGAFDNVVSTLENQARVSHAFRHGGGVPWGEQASCMFCAVAKFFRPGYRHHLVQDWLPALEGVVDRLTAGADVADVGCGHGLSTVIMAEAFPNSRFVGFDFHESSVAHAREHAAAHGLGEDRVSFQVATAKNFDGEYDFVTVFDALHDMGDPVGAAAHVRSRLRPGGSWMIVEPMAGDSLSDNLNPVGRLYYAASTMICVPTSLAQEEGAALGAQAGEKRLREVLQQGGFQHVRRATQTPFNMVLEARG